MSTLFLGFLGTGRTYDRGQKMMKILFIKWELRIDALNNKQMLAYSEPCYIQKQLIYNSIEISNAVKYYITHL